MGKNEEALSTIEREARAALGHSRPGGWYSPDGDCLFFYSEDVPCEAVRLTGLVTVFEAIDDERPVGLQIEGVRSLVKRCRQLQAMIEKSGSLELVYLLNFAITFSDQLPAKPPVLLAKTLARSAEWTLPAREIAAAVAGG